MFFLSIVPMKTIDVNTCTCSS